MIRAGFGVYCTTIISGTGSLYICIYICIKIYVYIVYTYIYIFILYIYTYVCIHIYVYTYIILLVVQASILSNCPMVRTATRISRHTIPPFSTANPVPYSVVCGP